MAVIAALLVIAAVILAVKVRGDASQSDGLVIRSGQTETVIPWDDLDQISFTGEIINGKGEISTHEYRGVELITLFKDKGIEITANTKITASSEDNYMVEISGEEILMEDKVYAAVSSDDEMIENIEGGQGAQLVVYGDENAKRQVRYLKIITVE